MTAILWIIGVLAAIGGIGGIMQLLSKIETITTLVLNILELCKLYKKVSIDLKIISTGTINIVLDNKGNSLLKIKNFYLKSNDDQYLIKELSGKEIAAKGELSSYIDVHDVFGYHYSIPFSNVFIGKIGFYLVDDNTNKTIPVSVKRKTINRIKKELESKEKSNELELALYTFLGRS